MFQVPRFKLYNSNAGVGLVEIIVAMGLFSTLSMLVGATFIDALNIQRSALNAQQVVENASFILETMAKEIRVSSVATANTNCPNSPATSLNFSHPVNGAITYSLVNGAINRQSGSVIAPVTSDTIEFTRLQFCITGVGGDRRQPRITILASARSRSAKQQKIIDIQTTISQRLLDL